MSRIRTVKPEFWQHPKVTSVSRDARLLFLGLLNEADDAGRMRYGAKRLAGVLFGDDEDVTPGMLEVWIGELERARLVRRYTIDDAPYLVVLGFTEHQSINRPSPSRLPEPPGSFTEDRVSDPGDVTTGREQGTGNREEEQGKTSVELALVESSAAPTPPDPVLVVFDAWQIHTGHRKAALTPDRRKRIREALKHYPVGDLVDACRGVHLSPHHRGDNDRHTVYDDLEHVLKNSKNIETFRDLARGDCGSPLQMPANSDLTQRNLARMTGGT